MTIHQPISITIDLKNKMFNLFFSIIPEIVTSINGDSTIKKYFDNFFKFFTPNYVTNNFCVINDNEKRNQYIKNYQNVENSHQMKVYFESIPGLYSKLALWAMDNSYQGNNPSEHHLILRSLRLPFDFNQRQISISYNFVQVHWLVHYLFHYIRLIEYGQIQDEKALYGLLQKKQTIKPSSLIMLSQEQRNTLIENQNNFLTNLRKNYVQFEQERSECYKRIGKIVGSQKLSESAKIVLATNTIWYHQDDYNKKLDEAFILFCPAQPENEQSLQTLAETLIQAEYDRNNMLGLVTIERDMENVALQLGSYLRGADQRASVYDFYLSQPPVGSCIIPKSLPGNERFIQIQRNRYKNKDELKVLDNVSGYKLRNPSINRNNNILTNIKKFNTFYEVATLCTEIEKEVLGHYLSKEPIKKYRSGLSEYLKRQWLELTGIKKPQFVKQSAKGYLGWKLEKQS